METNKKLEKLGGAKILCEIESIMIFFKVESCYEERLIYLI